VTTGRRFRRVLPWALVRATVLGLAACGGSPEADTMQEGVATPISRWAAVDPDAGQRSSGQPAAACAVPEQGCLCLAGQIVECVGPKIQSGDYASCPPGRRVCTDGVWGPCLAKTVYRDVDAFPE